MVVAAECRGSVGWPYPGFCCEKLTGSGVGHSERSEGKGERNCVRQSWELFRITAALHQLRSVLNGYDGFSAHDEQRSN